MKIDMSPEAITNRLKIMEQLWELSVNLMQAEPLENGVDTNSESTLLSGKTFNKDLNNSHEDKARQHLDKLPSV